MWFNACVHQCTLMCQNVFTWIIMCESMHINMSKFVLHELSCVSQWTLICQNFFTWLSCIHECTLIYQIFFTSIIMCEFMHNNVIKTFYMSGSMHINWSYDQTIIKIPTLIKLQI